jgi:hypothetical protein
MGDQQVPILKHQVKAVALQALQAGQTMLSHCNQPFPFVPALDPETATLPSKSLWIRFQRDGMRF